MKTYRFYARSTRGGFMEWAVGREDGRDAVRIDRDVYAETVAQFRVRAARTLESEGYRPEENQYTL